MNNNFNWAGVLCIGASFFAILITLSSSENNSVVYAVASLFLALFAIPFSYKSITEK